MSKKIYLDAFYDQYEDFLHQMMAVFPGDPEWPRYRTAVVVFRKANPTTLVQKTWECVAPYEAAITQRDESFFLQQEIPEGPMTHTLVKLKSLWQQLDVHNRSVVWDYVRNITYLAKRCAA
jgi:hypothetical protein